MCFIFIGSTQSSRVVMDGGGKFKDIRSVVCRRFCTHNPRYLAGSDYNDIEMINKNDQLILSV